MQETIPFDCIIHDFQMDLNYLRCLNCGKFYSGSQHPVCPGCTEDQSNADHLYYFSFIYSKIGSETGETNKVTAIGRIMNQVMGFPAQIFMNLMETFPGIDSAVYKYFVQSRFLISIVDGRAISFSLPKGNKITFRKFLSFQPGFEEAEPIISRKMMEIYSNEDSEENDRHMDECIKRFTEIFAAEIVIPDKEPI